MLILDARLAIVAAAAHRLHVVVVHAVILAVLVQQDVLALTKAELHHVTFEKFHVFAMVDALVVDKRAVC